MTARSWWAIVAAGSVALVGCGPPPARAPGGAPAAPPTSEASGYTIAPPSTAPPAHPRGRADDYPEQPAGVPFPTEEWPTGVLPGRIDPAAIDTAVDRAFGADDAAARVQSIVVVNGGRIVYERYHPLDGPETVLPSFSVAKSFTSAVIGLLVSDGELALDEPPDVPEWQGRRDPRQAITLRDLLQMSSGLQWDEVYEAGADPLEMLGARDAAAYVAAKPLESEPGTVFEYSTGTTALLAGIAADALGGCRPAIRYLNRRLLEPLGITSARLHRDPGGCWYGGLGADMRTRDFARFGLLYLRGGSWDGEQILPTTWIDETRVPAATNPEYGLQWWLERDGSSFRAEGLFGQRIVVVPGLDLVVAVNSTAGGDPYTLIATVVALFAGQPPPPVPAPDGTLPASR
jgi:CubicO group peptidase (beta-lactamase class C family)